MSGRRAFLAQAVVAGAVVALEGLRAWADEPSVGRAAKPLRVLILGGTGHIGPFFVRAAVARGHKVSVFSRGKEHADLPAAVEHLVGDRNDHLEAIEHRDWDAVLDLATFGPLWVRSLGEALKGHVGHYTFISSVGVYDNPGGNATTREDSKVLAYHGSADPYATPVIGESPEYGALKILCEKEAERQFPGKALVLRPGYVVLPGDLNGFVTYWPVRAQKGGEMLAAGERSTPIQYIDIRDLAEWALRLVEKSVTGVYNAVGPTVPATLDQLVNAARAAVPKAPQVTWVPIEWLTARSDAGLWGQLLFWHFQDLGGQTRINIEKAIAAGLATRPLPATLAAVLQWYKEEPPEQRAVLITGHQKDKDGRWTAVSTSWTDYLQQEKATLGAWHARKQQS